MVPSGTDAATVLPLGYASDTLSRYIEQLNGLITEEAPRRKGAN